MERVDARGMTEAPVYLSGDHNPDGVRSLVALLPHYPRRKLHALVGIGRDKDAENILGPLSRVENTSIYLTVTPFRGRTLAEYGNWRARAAGSWEDPIEAFREVARLAGSEDLLLVTGSLYLVGEVRKLLLQGASG
jgi:dihydrofolate synthase/folylpolyglutamate synthase